MTPNATVFFSKNPEIYIPNAHVRYVRYEGTEQKQGVEMNLVKDERFYGAIPILIQKVSRFLEISFKDYYFLNLEEGRFMRVPEYPKDAWLEGLVNALCHRSYDVQGNPILISHYDDRLEISNSGPLPAQVTEENIREERYSRNVRVARILNEMGYVKELNEGVKRIYRVMAELRLDSPEYRQQNGYVYLTLKNKVSRHKQTIPVEVMERIEKGWKAFNTSQNAIIDTLFMQSEASLDDFVTATEVSEQAIRKNLNHLEDAQIIEKMTSKKRDRNAPYRFKSYHPDQ